MRQTSGAEEGTRTPTPLRVRGPEPRASANSATSARDTKPARWAGSAAILSLANVGPCVKSCSDSGRRLSDASELPILPVSVASLRQEGARVRGRPGPCHRSGNGRSNRFRCRHSVCVALFRCSVGTAVHSDRVPPSPGERLSRFLESFFPPGHAGDPPKESVLRAWQRKDAPIHPD